MQNLSRARYFQMTFLFFILFSCALKLGYSKILYSRYIRDFQDLELLELRIVKHLTQVLLSSNTLPIHSEIRGLAELYVSDFYQSCGLNQIKDVYENADTTRISKNPICSFRLISRVQVLLRHLMSHKSSVKLFGPLWTNVSSFFSTNGWPDSDDMQTAAEKILRLQQVYDFNVEQFANGWIASVQTNCTLNSEHCYEIGKIALKSGHFASSIEWLELAKEKAAVDKKTSADSVAVLLWEAIEKHNSEFDEDIMMDMDPVFFDREISHEANDSKKAMKLRNLQYDAFKGAKYQDKLSYLGLCSGENLQSENEKSHLFCWYESKIHPSLLIGPRKIEFLTRNPDVIRLYDIIHDKEIQNVVSNSFQRMMESSVHLTNFDLSERRAKGTRTLTSDYRTSVNTWYSGDIDLVWSRRIEQVTGLNVGGKASEQLQVASYSFGGHYIPHMDEFSEVEQGGDTAFTSLGVAAKPIKGSAVFWHNLFKDGGPDWSTMHGACPVLLGEKWAANKWIKLKSQFFVRKCSLKIQERFQIPVNGVNLPLIGVQTR